MDTSLFSRSWPRVAVSLVAAALMAVSLHRPIYGDFYFRQSHVVANIEKYLEDGLSLHPETYNYDVPFSLFDFPAYQIVVVELCKLLGTEVLPTARMVEIVLFLLCVLALDLVMSRCGVAPPVVLLTELLFCCAPLILFYFASPMVDGLALSLSYLSLYGYLRWDRTESKRGLLWYAVLLGAGCLSTLTKNPVYLPVFVAVLAHTLVRHGPKGVLRPAFIAYLGFIGASVVLFKLYSNVVNQVPQFMTGQESMDYFGPLRDRWDLRSWARVFFVTLRQSLNPLALVLSILGVVHYARRDTNRDKSCFLGLFVGVVFAEIVFFNRYTWHNYYQLPLVFPLAFFAAYGALELRRRGDVHGGWSRAFRSAPVLLGAFAILWAAVELPKHTERIQWIEANGLWIREHTSPSDFVVYLLDTDDPTDWNPVFLYFAHRNGFNLTRHRFSRHPEVLGRIRKQWAPETGRLLVFCPTPLLSELAPRLETSSLRLLEAGAEGRLYLFTALPEER